jgi:hypothetical protein
MINCMQKNLIIHIPLANIATHKNPFVIFIMASIDIHLQTQFFFMFECFHKTKHYIFKLSI